MKKNDLGKALSITGLRIYTEGVDRVEAHHKGEVVRDFSNKGQARLFVEGAAWAVEHLVAPGRSAPGEEEG